MSNSYKILDWDTDFFGFKVAGLYKNCLSDSFNRSRVLKVLADDDLKLAYYTSEIKLDCFSAEYDIDLIISRLPLVKKLEKDLPIHDSISFYQKSYPNHELIALAKLAGRQGRFGLDPKISDEDCDRLFENWIINSVNKKLAKEILIYTIDSEIVGFTTINIKGDEGSSPLFAVKKEHEGKGISFALMRAAETILKREGCEIVTGGTHASNVKALKVYERFGLIPQQPEYIYHLWKKK